MKSTPRRCVSPFRVHVHADAREALPVLPCDKVGGWRYGLRGDYPKSRSNAIGVFSSQWNCSGAVLESSGSEGTRQRLASDLVCAAGAVLSETLTLILSFWQKERRARGSVLAIADSSRN